MSGDQAEVEKKKNAFFASFNLLPGLTHMFKTVPICFCRLNFNETQNQGVFRKHNTKGFVNILKYFEKLLYVYP